MQLNKINIIRRFLSLSQRRNLARALRRYSPLAHLVIHNLYFSPRFLLIISELHRLETILRSAQIRYYLKGSILSLALVERLLPHDIDLIIEWHSSLPELKSFLSSKLYRITNVQGDILFLKRHGIIIDVFVFHVGKERITYHDGRKKIRVEFEKLMIDSSQSGSFRFLLRTRPLPPLAFIWYFLEVVSKIPPQQ